MKFKIKYNSNHEPTDTVTIKLSHETLYLINRILDDFHTKVVGGDIDCLPHKSPFVLHSCFTYSDKFNRLSLSNANTIISNWFVSDNFMGVPSAFYFKNIAWFDKFIDNLVSTLMNVCEEVKSALYNHSNAILLLRAIPTPDIQSDIMVYVGASALFNILSMIVVRIQADTLYWINSYITLNVFRTTTVDGDIVVYVDDDDTECVHPFTSDIIITIPKVDFHDHNKLKIGVGGLEVYNSMKNMNMQWVLYRKFESLIESENKT